jgi:hypothetical protein
MLKTLLLTAALIGIAVLLLGFRIFFFKDGKFPDTHVGKNKFLAKKGIRCAQTQDREARTKSNEITKK